MRTAAILTLALALAGCATPQTVPVTVCVPVVAYTADQQDKLADEVEALPEGSMILRAILDYSAMRDAARACSASR